MKMKKGHKKKYNIYNIIYNKRNEKNTTYFFILSITMYCTRYDKNKYFSYLLFSSFLELFFRT